MRGVGVFKIFKQFLRVINPLAVEFKDYIAFKYVMLPRLFAARHVNHSDGFVSSGALQRLAFKIGKEESVLRNNLILPQQITIVFVAVLFEREI